MKWAPSITRGHLIEYILKLWQSADGCAHHTGVAVAVECVLQNVGYSAATGTLLAAKLKSSANSDSSASFLARFTWQCRHLGEVDGMMLASPDISKTVGIICTALKTACSEANGDAFCHTLYRATALFIATQVRVHLRTC